jgi:dipeptide/tripeptide permease
MSLYSLPNDILPTLNPLTIILLIPLCTQYIYPFILNTLRLPFPPVTRITAGFALASLSMACASILQFAIYHYPPKSLSIGWQVPLYPLLAASEIMASITGLELAYSEAPEKMKSLIMSLFLLTSAGGSVLGVIVSPVARDPWLGWMYLFLAVVVGGTAIVFWRTFGGQEKRVAEEVELEGMRNV